MSVTHKSFNERSHALVHRLVALADPARRDRAGLARLRGALQPSRRLEALPIVSAFVEPTDRDEDAALLVAGLFAMHPEHRKGSTLGKALGRLASRQEGGSIEARFRALLSCSASELPVHLRHAVSLVAGDSSAAALDFVDLHGAIRFWDHEDNYTPTAYRSARRRWARDFWAPSPTSPDEPEPEADASAGA